MAKLNKDFFTNNEVLFVGYSGKNPVFSREVYKAFTRSGIKVYPMNSKESGNYDVKVYKSLAELSRVPETAYVLLKKENAAQAVKQLAAGGVKRVLFQNKRNVDESILAECKKLGMEAVVTCPMMTFGTGIHKLHAFFAGAR